MLENIENYQDGCSSMPEDEDCEASYFSDDCFSTGSICVLQRNQ